MSYNSDSSENLLELCKLKIVNIYRIIVVTLILCPCAERVVTLNRKKLQNCYYMCDTNG